MNATLNRNAVRRRPGAASSIGDFGPVDNRAAGSFATISMSFPMIGAASLDPNSPPVDGCGNSAPALQNKGFAR